MEANSTLSETALPMQLPMYLHSPVYYTAMATNERRQGLVDSETERNWFSIWPYYSLCWHTPLLMQGEPGVLFLNTSTLLFPGSCAYIYMLSTGSSTAVAEELFTS